MSSRFGKNFVEKIPILNTDDNNEHWGAWRGGIQQGLLTPIKGIGPSGTRKTCAKLDTNEPTWLSGKSIVETIHTIFIYNYFLKLVSLA